MEETERRVLALFRTRLANEIVVTASFLSAFCDNSVLDEEMTRIVKSEENYAAKAQRLLELLPKRGPKALKTLMEILETTNPWLAEKMKSALHEERNKEAKLKTSSSASEAASIKGYGSSNLRNVDNDLKAVAQHFVKANLLHLTDNEQRTTARWMGEEMQRERRRQQFRTPHTFRRHPEEFQSSKETQTDMTGMEFQELCEDIMMQQHGVDSVYMNCDFSFKMLHKQITDILQRQQKMDLLFIQCLEKFEGGDRYSMTLPELIERAVARQKELVTALMNDRRKMHKVLEERDSLEKTVRQMEQELDQLMKRGQSKVVHPQQMYLKKRKELQQKYTMTKQASEKAKKPHHGGDRDGGGGGGESSRVHHTSSSYVHDATLDHNEEEGAVGGDVRGERGGGRGGGGGGGGGGRGVRGGERETSPKARVRFSATTSNGSRSSISGMSGMSGMSAKRRPGTGSSQTHTKSLLKNSTK